MADYIQVGRIHNTHGIKGEVRVESLTDFASQRFAPGQSLYLKNEDGQWLDLVIESHRRHKQWDLLKFESYHNINLVLPWRGKSLYIQENQLEDLDEYSFYIHDMIGMAVIDRNGQRLGQLKEVLQAPANDVWRVERPGKKDLLLPAIKEVIRAVNLEKNQVTIQLLEGMDGHED